MVEIIILCWLGVKISKNIKSFTGYKQIYFLDNSKNITHILDIKYNFFNGEMSFYNKNKKMKVETYFSSESISNIGRQDHKVPKKIPDKYAQLSKYILNNKGYMDSFHIYCSIHFIGHYLGSESISISYDFDFEKNVITIVKTERIDTSS